MLFFRKYDTKTSLAPYGVVQCPFEIVKFLKSPQHCPKIEILDNVFWNKSDKWSLLLFSGHLHLDVFCF